MPPKKTSELPKGSIECILVTGKFNNIVQWRDEMQTAVSMPCGLTGTFFTTNIRHVPPIPDEADYIPAFPEAVEGVAPHPPLPAGLITKLREGAFEGRRKAMQTQRADESTIWPMMGSRMSLASKCKVKEEADFEDAHPRRRHV
jgi:hypothetical protein